MYYTLDIWKQKKWHITIALLIGEIESAVERRKASAPAKKE